MVCQYHDGEFSVPVDLGEPVNVGGASHAYIAPDESYMLFNSPRQGSYTGNDIWVSFRGDNGKWGDPKNIEPSINSGGSAVLCPTVSPDGKYLFFTRLKNGTSQLYWVSTDVFLNLR